MRWGGGGERSKLGPLADQYLDRDRLKRAESSAI